MPESAIGWTLFVLAMIFCLLGAYTIYKNGPWSKDGWSDY